MGAQKPPGKPKRICDAHIMPAAQSVFWLQVEP
jgi:hypothetical protein